MWIHKTRKKHTENINSGEFLLFPVLSIEDIDINVKNKTDLVSEKVVFGIRLGPGEQSEPDSSGAGQVLTRPQESFVYLFSFSLLI